MVFRCCLEQVLTSTLAMLQSSKPSKNLIKSCKRSSLEKSLLNLQTTKIKLTDRGTSSRFSRLVEDIRLTMGLSGNSNRCKELITLSISTEIPTFRISSKLSFRSLSKIQVRSRCQKIIRKTSTFCSMISTMWQPMKCMRESSKKLLIKWKKIMLNNLQINLLLLIMAKSLSRCTIQKLISSIDLETGFLLETPSLEKVGPTT